MWARSIGASPTSRNKRATMLVNQSLPKAIIPVPVVPIIDVHAHAFPQRVLDKIWAYFDKHHWPVYYRTDEAERTAAIEQKVARYTTLCYAHRPGMANWLNDYVLRFAAEHPRAIPTGTFFPEDEDVLRYVEDALKKGIRGFKLHLEVQRFDPADARLRNVYALLSEAQVPVLIHTAGAPLPGPWTGPTHFARLLKMAPRLVVIVAHLGAHEHDVYARFADDHPLYFDTAMVGVDYPGFGRLPEAMQQQVRAHPERYLFGSDFPNIPYPFEHQVEVVRSWGLDERGEALVFSENARRLYHL